MERQLVDLPPQKREGIGRMAALLACNFMSVKRAAEHVSTEIDELQGRSASRLLYPQQAKSTTSRC